MKPSERAMKALNHSEPDKVPFGELVVEEEFIKTFLDVDYVDAAVKSTFFHSLGHDITCLQQPGEIKYFRQETDFFIFGLVNGGLSRFIQRWKDFFSAMVNLTDKPAQASQFIQEDNLKAGQEAENLLAHGAHGVIIADDLAYDKDLFLSPKLLREMYFPSLKSVVKKIKSENHPVFFHSDGNYKKILQDLVDTGFDGIQCLEQVSGMDIFELKKFFGRQLCLMGGIDLGYLSRTCSVEKIAEHVQYVMKTGKPGGGYFFGTNGGLYGGLSADAVHKMYEIAKKQAHYK